MRLIDLSNELKAGDHDRKCSLNTYDKMSGGEIAGCTEPDEAALPEHEVQRVELQTDDQNEEHVAHHGPVEHFELEGGGGEGYG